MCLQRESTPVNWLEVETGWGRKLTFRRKIQEYRETLLCHTLLQTPTGSLQICHWALLVSARPLLVSARPLLLSIPWMPDVPRLPSLSPVFLYQRVRLPRKIFDLEYGGLRTDRISEVASVHKVCWTLSNLVRVHLCLANMSLHFESTPASCLEVETGGGGKLPFSGHNAGVWQDAVVPHSTADAHRTAPA